MSEDKLPENQTPVNAEVTPPVEPVVVNTTTPVKPKPSTPTITEFEKRVADVKATNNIKLIYVYNSLISYVEGMGKGTNVDDATGARYQYTLWSTIKNVINNYTPKDFKDAWNLILAFYKNHSGDGDAFSPKRINRFAHAWHYPEEELTALQAINDLIMLTMDHTKRSGNLRLISFEKTLRVGFTEEGRQRVMTYYNV